MNSVIIAGTGRSGTSMLAGTLARSGYYMGTDYLPPRESNPKGFFEGLEVNTINERILENSLAVSQRFRHGALRLARTCGMHWPSAQAIPRRGQGWLMPLALSAPARGSAVIDRQIAALTARAPFCFKDPRFSYTLPVWRPHLDLDRTVFLCVFRHPAETAASMAKECREQPYLRGMVIADDKLLELWRLMYGHILTHHRQHGRWLFVHYRQLLDRAFLPRLAAFTGARIDADFPDAALHRSRPGMSLGADTRAIYAELCALAGFKSAQVET
jgi:hypothetical protein